jgi:hypothetical protein
MSGSGSIECQRLAGPSIRGARHTQQAIDRVRAGAAMPPRARPCRRRENRKHQLGNAIPCNFATQINRVQTNVARPLAIVLPNARQQGTVGMSEEYNELRDALDALTNQVKDIGRSQSLVNSQNMDIQADHFANSLLFRVVIAALVAEATSRAREHVSALLDNPLEATTVREASSPRLAKSIQQAALYLKEELGKA